MACLCFRCTVLLLLGLLASASVWAVETIAPGPDSAVVEVLPAITRVRMATASAAPVDAAHTAELAQQAIGVARQTGDTRYWGRAQAVLAPWWDQPQAPTAMAILQATVQQGRHEFAAARAVLQRTLQRDPASAQAWLTLAALDRLAGNYSAAERACAGVQRAGAALYAQACRLETRSLLGEHAQAREGYKALLTQAGNAGQSSWLWSLLAESEERAGQDAAALQAYQRSLALESDLYTRIAGSDLLLRMGQSAAALKLLDQAPSTDAVLLRQAAALRHLGDGRWKALQTSLHEREAALRQRGDDPQLHARELALTALWLDDAPARALELAQRNLQLQREPLDWWLALQAAQQAGNSAVLQQLQGQIKNSGLVDMRLQDGAKAPKGPAR